MYIINFIRGFCMALADSVPGVSGGTIAFILGFYDKFINSLNDCVSGTKEKRKEAFFFLIKLGFGWVFGFGIAVLFLTTVFEAHIYSISSLFMGFILCSIPLVMKEEIPQLKGHLKNILFTVLGIALVAAVTYFNPVSGNEVSIEIGNLTFGLAFYIFIAAMIAISAMVLPGISGSTLLLIFGIYMPIISAIKEVMSFHFSYLPILIIFGLGMVAGIICVIKLIKIALEKFRSQTIYTILGLMLGSFYAIIMGPTTLDTPQPPMTVGTFSIVFFILGAVFVLGLERLKRVLEK